MPAIPVGLPVKPATQRASAKRALKRLPAPARLGDSVNSGGEGPPDLPANRYAEISVEVREICERYGLPYNVGPLGQQFGSVVRKICRLALPDSTSRRRRRAYPGVLLNGFGGGTKLLGSAVRKAARRVRPGGRSAAAA